MFKLHALSSVFRGLAVVAFAVLLIGCIPQPKPVAQTPTNLMAEAGNGIVTLNWSASSGAAGYSVKRSTIAGGGYAQISSTSSLTYSDTSVTNGTTYYYVVSALSSGGESINSAEVSATPMVPSIPLVPTNLTATFGDRQVTLAWSTSLGATSYRVKRATVDGGPYVQVAAPSQSLYLDTPLTNGTTYYYVVSAVNSLGESPDSAQVSASPSPPPPTTFGTWMNVTPAGIDLTSASLGTAGCGNYGTQTVQADAAHPSHLYAEFNCQGIWKSTDYGVTWTGPINTGTNGATVSDCGSGIAISPSSVAGAPTIYASCIRGAGLGFWKSIDGGTNWIQYIVTPTARQDYYPPVIDPYDPNHLLMSAHEFDSLVESTDGGQTWSSVPLANGMLQNGRTAFVFFINTGNAVTTRGTWLWIGEQSGGAVGTWRTSNGGTAWVHVDANEHPLGGEQLYQPDAGGVVFMAGANSALGWGVLRSSDYGQTWTHVGDNSNRAVVVGTSKDIYSMYGSPAGPGVYSNPLFAVASQPGTGTWVAPNTPAGLFQGAAQIGVLNDGVQNILVGAMWSAGLWRYVEP